MNKRKVLLVILVLSVILAAVLAQSTLAYYSSVGKVTNVVTSGELVLKIREKTADDDDFPSDGVHVIPGDTVSKQVSVENACDHPFYLRMKLINSIDNASLSAADCLAMDINTQDWEVREDGYIYYRHILQPREISSPVFTQVQILGEHVDQTYLGSTLSLTVAAYAVQSENNPADYPWEAAGWPAD